MPSRDQCLALRGIVSTQRIDLSLQRNDLRVGIGFLGFQLLAYRIDALVGFAFAHYLFIDTHRFAIKVERTDGIGVHAFACNHKVD